MKRFPSIFHQCTAKIFTTIKFRKCFHSLLTFLNFYFSTFPIKLFLWWWISKKKLKFSPTSLFSDRFARDFNEFWNIRVEKIQFITAAFSEAKTQICVSKRVNEEGKSSRIGWKFFSMKMRNNPGFLSLSLVRLHIWHDNDLILHATWYRVSSLTFLCLALSFVSATALHSNHRNVCSFWIEWNS